MLKNKKILLIVSASIASYKACEIARLLTKQNASVKVVLSQNTTNFITPITFQALTKNPVRISQFDENAELGMSHIELAKWPDLILIAPASANIIATCANGIANDLIGTIILATQSPIFIAPSMNKNMLDNLATKKNLSVLQKRNFQILPTDIGEQACGDNGYGRLLEPYKIIEELKKFLFKRKKNIKVTITAGPTYEYLDPVRFIGNLSSGKMGFSIAQSFLEDNYIVNLISGPTQLDEIKVDKFIKVTNADQMLQAILDCETDIFISTAAVSDYKPKLYNQQKIKKNNFLDVEFIKNIDILETIANSKNKPFCVGFAAETENIEENAKIKLLNKKLDIIISNDVSNKEIGFNSDYNEVTFITRNETLYLEKNTKKKIASQIKDLIIKEYKKSINKN